MATVKPFPEGLKPKSPSKRAMPKKKKKSLKLGALLKLLLLGIGQRRRLNPWGNAVHSFKTNVIGPPLHEETKEGMMMISLRQSLV
ncbi:hypothetical protein Nepgr_026098 [Nepenthes gracilis]|uniref:Uncharacterized protein n=1 Tax=Nepenthes gracilis TaxID=150966 RepID=A0AAD3Y1R0_NEPGR|nr:hypothetical protein Nepgr_026098 [Nepenthes gracilis]